MHNLKLKQSSQQDQTSPALQRKLDKMLEEAGFAFDKTYSDGNADQTRLRKLRYRSRTLALKVLSKQRGNTDAHNLLGRIALDEGDLFLAKKYLEQGLAYSPNSAALNYSRAHVYLATQNYESATKYFSRAEALAPNTTRAQASMAYTKTKQGLYVEAFGDYRALIKRDPTDPHIRSKLFECINQIKADYHCLELEQELITYLEFSDVDHDQLSNMIASLLSHKYDLQSGNSPLDPYQLSNDILLNKALRRVTFRDPIMEEFLSAVRQCILLESIDQQKISEQLMTLLVSLSLQCLTNEFVYTVSLEEDTILNGLSSIVNTVVDSKDWQAADVEYPLLLISMYTRLHNHSFSNPLLAKPSSTWSNPVRVVFERHLLEAENELALKQSITAITPICTDISRQVGQQYEEHPYPRWHTLAYAEKTDYGQALTSELIGFTPPSFFRDQTINILIAGCGTGKHAISVANNFRNVAVTAIDLSRSSLAYGTKMAIEKTITNVEFYQADILELKPPEETDQYHIIECSGVLHHMLDPMEGWQRLTEQLAPFGLMKIGLYSQRARQVITLARGIIQQNQLNSSDEHIRIFRQAILEKTIQGDFSEVVHSDDFYNLSGCRDLLFHVIEHHYSPIDLADSLQKLNLEFLGFVNLPHAIKQLYDNQFGLDKTRTNLANWDQLEAKHPHIFSAMYQFYVQLKPA